jgi:hypothetical protein
MSSAADAPEGIFSGATHNVFDHKNPKTWDDYPELDEFTKQTFRAMMTPKVYMHQYYSTHTFGQLTAALNGCWKDVEYLIMDGNGVVRLGVTPEEKQKCRKLDCGAKHIISQFVTTVNTNILNGDCGKLSNLSGVSFLFKSDDIRVLEGFIPYFYFSFDQKELIHVYFTSKLTILQFHRPQHGNAFQYMQTTATLKKFDKMCAWCGNLHGTGKHDRLLKCKCKTCRYCTKDCQTMHWPFHMGVCKVVTTRSTQLE